MKSWCLMGAEFQIYKLKIARNLLLNHVSVLNTINVLSYTFTNGLDDKLMFFKYNFIYIQWIKGNCLRNERNLKKAH